REASSLVSDAPAPCAAERRRGERAIRSGHLGPSGAPSWSVGEGGSGRGIGRASRLRGRRVVCKPPREGHTTARQGWICNSLLTEKPRQEEMCRGSPVPSLVQSAITQSDIGRYSQSPGPDSRV